LHQYLDCKVLQNVSASTLLEDPVAKIEAAEEMVETDFGSVLAAPVARVAPVLLVAEEDGTMVTLSRC
jgi:hypothetical protein